MGPGGCATPGGGSPSPGGRADPGDADPAETEAVLHVPPAVLAGSAHRFRLRAGGGAWRGPGFRVGDDVVWGFTGDVVDAVLRLGGWERPPGPELEWESL